MEHIFFISLALVFHFLVGNKAKMMQLTQNDKIAIFPTGEQLIIYFHVSASFPPRPPQCSSRCAWVPMITSVARNTAMGVFVISPINN